MIGSDMTAAILASALCVALNAGVVMAAVYLRKRK
jgi:hypothetical protein